MSFRIVIRRDTWMLHLALGAAMAVSLTGCAAGSSGGDTVTTDAGDDGSKTHACAVDHDCDDGFGCTIDTCSAGTCSHTVGANSGATACPAGEYCTVDKGCVKSQACAKDADCADANACHAHVRCDAATSVCIWDVLDKDGDGHPPQVCGGDDCNDGDRTIYPGAPETCDGKDNDCDGTVDDGASCGDPKQACSAGTCQCKPEYSCGSSSSCVDKSTDTYNCGTCGNACPIGASCNGGVCQCSASKPNACGAICTDEQTDARNCGACGTVCPVGAACVGGTCGACPSTAPDICGGTCVDRNTNSANCGTCGHACPSGATCSGGTCQCTGGKTLCGNACVNLQSDVTNCGSCGNACPTGYGCNGTCTRPADWTTGNACSSDAQCDPSGSTGARCIAFTSTTAVCAGASCDISAGDYSACQGGAGYCESTGTAGMCIGGCDAALDGSWVRQCPSGIHCVNSGYVALDATGAWKSAIGTCEGGSCASDADCPAVSPKCQKESMSCVAASQYLTYTKAIGASCTRPASGASTDCLCWANAGGQGYCASVCAIGGAACPTGMFCSALLPKTTDMGASAFTAQPTGMQGYCLKSCTTDADCASIPGGAYCDTSVVGGGFCEPGVRPG